MTPIGNNVIIRRRPKSEKIGSFVLPEKYRENGEVGRVVAVGPGTIVKNGKRVPPQVEEGDHVAFEMFAGMDDSIGEDLIIIPETKILCVLE